MNEREIAEKITAYLDQGAAGLKAGTAYRLQLAREKALAVLSEPSTASEPLGASVQGLALAGVGSLGGGGRRLLDARIWIAVLLILGSVLSFQYWQSVQQVREIEETDTAILTSELPIEAYLDRGFQNWLKQPEP